MPPLDTPAVRKAVDHLQAALLPHLVTRTTQPDVEVAWQFVKALAW